MHTLAFFLALPLLAQPVDSAAYAGLKWRMIGPYRGGRTVGVAGIPAQPNVFLIGANNGGVWKTTDFGQTWNPLFDDQPTGSIGAVAIAPSDSNIIYVGSGEGLQRPDLSTGDGIFKSTDGGKSWRLMTPTGDLHEALQIGQVVVDPRDANKVWVAALGHPYGPNPERGLYLTTDGGATWKKVLDKGENSGAVDLWLDPVNPDIIYVDFLASRQMPWEIGGAYTGPGSGLFKSADGGATWHELSRGLPADRSRIGLGISPSDPKRIYGWVVSKDQGGIYRSDDAGESWVKVNGEIRIWDRGDDFSCIRVHPRDPNVVFVANTSTYRSNDGGKTWTAIKGAPGGDDYHTIWINPVNPSIMIITSDQGATVTVNGGETWTSWYNQPTAQFYHVITDNQFPYWVYGGQQESGSAGVASRGNDGQITMREWHPVGAEEYGFIAPDPLNPGIIYGGKLTRHNRKTGDTQDVTPQGDYRFLRTAPVVFSPVDPHVLYFASQYLLKTTSGGNTWTRMSPDLSRAKYEIPKTVGVFDKLEPKLGARRGVIYAVAPSYQDLNVIWCGTDDGLIHRTPDGGRSWADVTPPDLAAWSKISVIDAGRFDAQTAYAAVNRIRLDDYRPYLYRTHDGGKTWSLIVTGIPTNETVNAVREDPVRKGLLFAATERAVYVSFDDGDHWQSLRLNMPATSNRDIVIHDNDLVTGTHGRGFWILDDISPLRQITTSRLHDPVILFEPGTAYRVRRNQNTDTPMPKDEPAGKNPPDGAILYYRLANNAAAVKLEIIENGAVIRTYRSDDKAPEIGPEVNVPHYWIRRETPPSAKAGMHRFVWDLYGEPVGPIPGMEYPISAIVGGTPMEPRGVLVAPGKFTVRLTVDGSAPVTQSLTVKMDPRVTTSQAALVQQNRLAHRLVDAINKTNDVARKTMLAGLLNVIEGSDSAPTAQAIQKVEQVLGK